jgi:hypothetical protein
MKINWHIVAIVVSTVGAAVTSLESTDPKHLQYYLTAMFLLHAIQAGLGLSASKRIEKLSGNSGPPSPSAGGAGASAAAAALCIFFLFGMSVTSPGERTATAPVMTEIQAGCGASNPNIIQPLITVGQNLGICVIQAAVGDLPEAFTDPASLIEAIASSCTKYGIATAAQILATIEEAIASSPSTQVPPSSPDAGTSSVTLLRLQKVRDAAAHVIAQNNVQAFGGTPK